MSARVQGSFIGLAIRASAHYNNALTQAAYVESGSRTCEVLRECCAAGKDEGGLAFLIRVPAKVVPDCHHFCHHYLCLPAATDYDDAKWKAVLGLLFGVIDSDALLPAK